MSSGFFKFPHTPHLMWMGGEAPRNDKVLSRTEVDSLLDSEVIVEEKVDGANLGLSAETSGVLRLQNRGSVLIPPYSGQFARLPSWLAKHSDALSTALTPSLIAFGEWCAAKHSILYDRLPDWWLLFDLYDVSQQRFLPTAAREEFSKKNGLAKVAEVFRGRVTTGDLTTLLLDSLSHYRSGPIEGLIIRREDAAGVITRAKLVRPDFTQSIQHHWKKRHLEWNRMA